MTAYERKAVWGLWHNHLDTMDIARKLGHPEYEVDRVLHQYLDKCYEIRKRLS